MLLNGLSYYKKHRRYLLIIASTYYGLILLTAVLTMNVKDFVGLQASIKEETLKGILETFPGLLEVYMRYPILAVVYTFLVNFCLGSVLTITIPGILLFFLAPVIAFYRAALWGLLYAPTTPDLATVAILALPTLVLEGLGYVLAVIPSTYLGLSWLMPRRVFHGEELTRVEAFKRELGSSVKAYLWVAIVLLVAAVVEVTTVQLMLPR